MHEGEPQRDLERALMQLNSASSQHFAAETGPKPPSTEAGPGRQLCSSSHREGGETAVDHHAPRRPRRAGAEGFVGAAGPFEDAGERSAKSP